MSEPVSYPVPWDLVFSLTPHIARGARHDVDGFTRALVARMRPEPLIEGLDLLPRDPRFVLAANHYQRKGLWILHSAAVLTQAIRRAYGPGDPPVRWLVTANWPRWRFGPWSFRSPGDILLPKVAHALWCYPVSFAGADPVFTARSLRALLRDAKTFTRPVGIFPEGAAGAAGRLNPALPGVDRLLRQLKLPIVPAAISEAAARLCVRFGPAIPPESDCMAAIEALL